MDAAQRLTPEEQGEIARQVVALITARRSGLDEFEIGKLISTVYMELIDSTDPVRSAMRHGYLLAQLTHAAATACDEWNKTSDDHPADRWLAQAVAVTTDMRGGG